MKKLLLASIIMFGVCSFASAQTQGAVKTKKQTARNTTPATTAATPAFTNAAGVTPSKSAVTTTTDEVNASATVQSTDAQIAAKQKAIKETEKPVILKKNKKG